MGGFSDGVEGLFHATAMYLVGGVMPCLAGFARCCEDAHGAVFVAHLLVGCQGGCSSYELERERRVAQI